MRRFRGQRSKTTVRSKRCIRGQLGRSIIRQYIPCIERKSSAPVAQTGVWKL